MTRGGEVVAVALGGGLGAVLRTAQSAALPWGPAATLAENLLGAFLLGLLLQAVAGRPSPGRVVRPLLGTGLLGAYTSYATVGLELHLLVAAGRPEVAALYLGATAAGGLLAGGAGIAAGRALRSGGREGR